MLELSEVETFHGDAQALFGVSFGVGEGEVVALLGRNGMGKSTTVESIAGLLVPRRGEIRFQGTVISGRPAHLIARAGIGLVPEGRRVFPNLTVEENLVATAIARRGASWTLDAVYALFPPLAALRRRMAANLSGGEQQMVAIGRALMTNPSLLILDEATEGLAPLVREQIWAAIRRLAESKLAILVIDKTLDALLALAHRHVVLEKGRVAWTGTSAQLADEDFRHRTLGI
ncbi:ABC transporter ATP-binding protein [Magnetospirillum sp. UT-4]|uniref:ABC transporter ATP-binding protein n=1 Tax=Magnetospirillum sp. UT-4 TaxID=2681467 RepID=UPI0013838263|nr:ABC transporter ATP-binding protein [Magnetospirillum sp. UT-4]CAA7627024.1 leucine/isoleucine/valine transporter subunit; ATP-binding component of ABC superfamily [Magnetospirillum sp. UT-4]